MPWCIVGRTTPATSSTAGWRSACGGCRSSIWPAGTSRSSTKTGRLPSSSTARSTTIASCAPSWKPRATASRPPPTPKSSSTCGRRTGIDFPRRLNGMFAIALVRSQRSDVCSWCATMSASSRCTTRLSQDGLVFGSEVKVLLASGRVARRLDVDSLGQFLSLGVRARCAARCSRDIRRLEPGEVARSGPRLRPHHQFAGSGSPLQADRRLARTSAASGLTKSDETVAPCGQEPAGQRRAARAPSCPAASTVRWWSHRMGPARDLQHRFRRSQLQRNRRGPSGLPTTSAYATTSRSSSRRRSSCSST